MATLRSLAATIIIRIASALGIRVSRTIAGQRFYFRPGTDIGLQLLAWGVFEPQEIAICKQLLSEDSVAIDIGANIGLHAVHFASFCPQGLVIAVEPASSTFQQLTANLRSRSNIVALNVAMSERNMIADFFVAIDDAYSGLKDTGRRRIAGIQKVACYSGDYLLAPILGKRRLDLVKIDVEGLEKEVLQGIQSLLTEHKPTVLCEILAGKKSNSDVSGTIRFCESLGYRTYVLRDKKLVPYSVHEDRYSNYFFIGEDKLDRVLPKLANFL